GTVVVFQNAHRYIDNVAVAQAIANLRESFKQDQRTLVLLAPAITLPAELANDVLILDEPLPDDTAIQQLIGEVIQAAGLAGGEDGDSVEFAIDALRGLSLFGAEQVFAMSLSQKGIDRDALWERKRKMIEATPGLSVWRGGETFKDIGGVEQIKTFMRRIVTGKNPPKVVVWIDEIEKMLAGSGANGDTSGGCEGFVASLLTHMQDHESRGALFIGPPGASKSMVAKATGAEAGIPTISLDLGAMQGSLVGQSEERLRAALKVITAVGGDNSLFIATCNGIAILPPELRRRFGLGTWFFDLPSEREREVIWNMYLKQYGLADTQSIMGVKDEGWTGAEIRQCVSLAHDLEINLPEASEYIVPVARAAKEIIETLRRESDGRYISASSPGVYKMPSSSEALENVPKKRQLNVKGR